jgi:SpoVK/Ycf46/Vps4 family AAA+-type ATPase
MDEIDALFGARLPAQNGSAIAHRGVITEFMQEMDGLKSSKDDRVIVIGATNRPFDLDDAVLRRLPRRLLVDLPGVKEREEILKILLRDENLSPGVDLKALAKRSESFSGSDLKRRSLFWCYRARILFTVHLDLCVSAALDAVKERVVVPWITTPDTKSSSNPVSAATSSALSLSTSTPNPVPSGDSSPTSSPDSDSSAASSAELKAESHARILSSHHFDKAFKEIIPSSSEALGSLADLRKWNEEFGEGKKDKKRQQVWGKDRFGFIDKTEKVREEGRVASIGAPSSESDRPGVGK